MESVRSAAAEATVAEGEREERANREVPLRASACFVSSSSVFVEKSVIWARISAGRRVIHMTLIKSMMLVVPSGLRTVTRFLSSK